MHKSTMVELVVELKKLPQSSEIEHMIEEAKAGEYHDYKNTKYICGKMESSNRLRKLGFTDLAVRIENGEFDEEPDEDDIEMIVSDLGNARSDITLKDILGLNKGKG